MCTCMCYFSVVVKDDLLSSVEASPNIKHLLHYLLPSNKNDFTRRHTLLHPSIKSNNRPSVTIIVNDDCVEQSKDLVQLLERLDQPVPEMLSKLAEEKQRVINDGFVLYVDDRICIFFYPSSFGVKIINYIRYVHT